MASSVWKANETHKNQSIELYNGLHSAARICARHFSTLSVFQFKLFVVKLASDDLRARALCVARVGFEDAKGSSQDVDVVKC